ncbi:hypothetical protein [Pelagibacterium halotolerans]|uniref:hypothetical protein n=1 Tax=Pelagibacterium halotolerans TaxID=531813 RepID=UPI0002D649E0|nr:hypothetical protein [Pelagibacterium halotolerans]
MPQSSSRRATSGAPAAKPGNLTVSFKTADRMPAATLLFFVVSALGFPWPHLAAKDLNARTANGSSYV